MEPARLVPVALALLRPEGKAVSIHLFFEPLR
jgi:hypothetical protein